MEGKLIHISGITSHNIYIECYEDSGDYYTITGSNNVFIWNCKGYAAHNMIRIHCNDGIISSITWSSASSRKGYGQSSQTIRNTSWLPNSQRTYSADTQFNHNQLMYYDTAIQIYFEDSSDDYQSNILLDVPLPNNTYGETLIQTPYGGMDNIFINFSGETAYTNRISFQFIQPSNYDYPLYFTTNNTHTVEYPALTETHPFNFKSGKLADSKLFFHSSIYAGTQWWNSITRSSTNIVEEIPENGQSGSLTRSVTVMLGPDPFTWPIKDATYYNNGSIVYPLYTLTQNSKGASTEETSLDLLITDTTSTPPTAMTFGAMDTLDKIWYIEYGDEGVTNQSLKFDSTWMSFGSTPTYSSSGTTMAGVTWKRYYYDAHLHVNYDTSARTGTLSLTYTSNLGETYVDKVVITQKALGDVYFKPDCLYFYADSNAKTTTLVELTGLDNYHISNIHDTSYITPPWYHWTYVGDNVFECGVNEYTRTDDDRTETTYIEIDITNEDESVTITKEVPLTFYQYKDLEYTETPLWEDTYYTFTKDGMGYQYYRICDMKSNYKILYTGKLVFFSDDTKIPVLINDIARDYISLNTDVIEVAENMNSATTITTFDNGGFISLCLQASSDGENWDDIHRFHLYNNYDYSESHSMWISEPILDYIDSRQLLFFSLQNNKESSDSGSYYGIDINTELEDDSKKQRVGSLSVNSQAQKTMIMDIPKFIGNYNHDYFYIREYFGFDSQWGSLEATIAQIKIKIKNRCKNYAVYYMTPKGGWSWMLFDGKQIKQTKITYSNYRSNSFNNNPYNRQNIQYLKELVETWSLTTDRLTDEQSRKMQGLITSPYLYLHDLEDGKIYAVNCTDTSVDEKLRVNNNSRKRVTYTCKFENSQTKIRK